MSRANLTVEQQNDTLVIKGIIQAADETMWRAEALDDSRVLLRADEMLQGPVKSGRGAATCSIAVFRDLFAGLINSSFTGVIAVDTGFGVKRLFMTNGAVVFAGSNLIDDRLGEVLFRESKISLDDLTSSAAEVTKVRKFGQVLVANQVLSNVDLWTALKLQVTQILRSIFMAEQVFCEIHPGPPSASTEIVFLEHPEQILSDAFSYGAGYRGFVSRLRMESEIILCASVDQLHEKYPASTFFGDLITMMTQERGVQGFLNSSKLIDAYTVAALMHLVNAGVCKISPDIDAGTRFSLPTAALKSKLDSLSYVLQAIRRAFIAANREVPSADVKAFVAGLNDNGFPSFFIDEQGGLNRDCVAGLLSQVQDNKDQLKKVITKLESLIQFLLQVTGDNLDFKVAQAIRQEYRAV